MDGGRREISVNYLAKPNQGARNAIRMMYIFTRVREVFKRGGLGIFLGTQKLPDWTPVVHLVQYSV